MNISLSHPGSLSSIAQTPSSAPTIGSLRHLPLGWTAMAGNRWGLLAVMLGDSPETAWAALRQECPGLGTDGPGPEPAFLTPWLEGAAQALAGRPVRVPVALHGTVFQCRVWSALQATGRGDRISYGELALRLGAPTAARAVAAACARNRIAGLVPCHRVVRGDGDIGGYRWGVDRKLRLLGWEQDHGQPGLD